MNAFTRVLRDLGLYDNTLLIITADHGEGLEGDVGGTGHSGRPYLPRVRVPLILRLPGAVPAGIVVEENVQVLDIAPTILSILGAPPNSQFEGIALTGLMRGEKDATLLSRSLYCVGQAPQWKGMVKGDWYLFNDGGETGLFSLVRDPGQRRDLAPQREDVVAAMSDELARYTSERESLGISLAADSEASPLPVDPQTIQQLKALGYLE
jgi:arylsulfatase A-like enzyme